ncbi:TetR/AcrR family transcriptional regulator [Nocardia sp. NPDC058058]|uniref:TetR/AcrR family transcriptional regulator n=1 Tax=Nocardia sp. NPDC058058 TaxID=3346317 RepID=UPI0036DF23C0
MSKVTASPTGRPLRADALRNRELILDAAREVFARRGLDVTLADVAQHAGVGVGTIYRRFPNKEDLVEAVFERFFQDMAVAADRALREPDPWTALAQFFEFAGTHMAVNRGLIEVMSGVDLTREQRECQPSRAEPAVVELFTRAQEAGEIRPDAEPTDFDTLIYMIGAVAEFTQPVNPDTWRRYLALVLDGLRDHSRDRAPLPVPALSLAELEQAKLIVQSRRK